jgi:hypothetical protein
MTYSTYNEDTGWAAAIEREIHAILVGLHFMPHVLSENV